MFNNSLSKNKNKIKKILKAYRRFNLFLNKIILLRVIVKNKIIINPLHEDFI